MFSEEDLEKDLFLLSDLLCLDLFWFRLCFVSHLHSKFKGFSFFLFFFLLSELSRNLPLHFTISHSDIFDSYQKQDLPACVWNWTFAASFFLSLSHFLQCPSSVLPPSFSALIFFWIAFDFPFRVEPTTRGIAVMAHTRKLQRWRCGLAAASCRAVYTEHLTMYLLGGCLCFVIPRFIIAQSSSQSCWGCWCC